MKQVTVKDRTDLGGAQHSRQIILTHLDNNVTRVTLYLGGETLHIESPYGLHFTREVLTTKDKVVIVGHVRNVGVRELFDDETSANTRIEELRANLGPDEHDLRTKTIQIYVNEFGQELDEVHSVANECLGDRNVNESKY